MRATLAILAIAFAAAAAVCFLPDNPYQRWQQLDDTIHAKARWIYERTHYDPTPVDVAFLGPSRIGAGVNAPQLQQALARAGVAANVVNFSLPETGENINEVIAQQLFATKRPKLVVIGVIEQPARFGHSAFKFLAPTGMIVDPGYPSDLNYVSDLSYLPYRQLHLFAANLAPGLLGMPKSFDPARYRGPTIDTTGSIVLPDGSVKNGEEPASAAELARGVSKLEHNTHPPLLPAADADIEFGDERHNIRQIAELAQSHGARVAFLFLPFYTGPSRVQEAPLYQQYGPVWNAGFLAGHAEWYADYAHLTRTGAQHLTDWLTAPVLETLKSTRGAG
jgi:hypothetical protein